jgi:hypothetical protein
MYVYVNMQIGLKDVPRDYVGIRNERWKMASDKPLPYDEMVGAIAHHIAAFYVIDTSADEMNRAAEALSKAFADLRFEPGPPARDNA